MTKPSLKYSNKKNCKIASLSANGHGAFTLSSQKTSSEFSDFDFLHEYTITIVKSIAICGTDLNKHICSSFLNFCKHLVSKTLNDGNAIFGHLKDIEDIKPKSRKIWQTKDIS